MLKTLLLSLAALFLLINAETLSAQPLGCQQLSFSVTDLGPCHYRLNATNLSVDCFNQASVLIQDGYFTSWTANSNAGWVVEQVSATELLLTHANGPFPLGSNWTIDFQFYVPGEAPTILTVLWPELCIMEGCAVELPLDGCAGACISGVTYQECGQLPYSNQPTLPDWTVTLTAPGGNVLGSQQTDNNGAYSFCDLPPGQYIVKTTLLPGWTPNVPASGMYAVSLLTSENAERNFGNCADCSCDQMEVVVVQDFVYDDTATYTLSLFNNGADCFHSLTITADSGALVDGVVLLPNWTIEQIGNTLILTPPGGTLPVGNIEPCKYRMAGIGTHQVSVSYSFGSTGTTTECRRPFPFPNPPVSPPSGCCPQGSGPGPELVVNGDFNANTAPGTDYAFIPGTGTLTPGQIAIRNQTQAYNSNNNWVCPGILGATDQYLVVDGHTSGGQSAWKQTITVQPGKQYVFCAFANNLVRPSRNFNDPMVELYITQGTPTNVVASSGPVTLTENPDLWVKISVPWTSTGTQCTIQIRSLSTQPDGNDFAVDQVSFRECLPLMSCVCDGNLVKNPGFLAGAAPGNLGNPGASANWAVASGSPQVDPNNGACDPVSMLMWGNQNLGESICQAVSFVPGNTYSVSFYAQYFNNNPNLTTPYVLFEMKAANNCVDPFTCNNSSCTVIGVSPQITNTTGWVQITLPNWTAPATPNPLNWLLVRATNNTPNVPGNAFTISWGRIDNICIKNVTPACNADFSVSINCGNVTLTNTSTGTAPITPLWSNSSSSNVQNLQLPCGSHTYCLTITDASGCTDVVCKTFTVSDIIPPVAVCVPGFGVDLDANCQYQLTSGQIDGGSTDNCQIQSMSVSPSVLTGCGISIVTLTVTDWCGNTSTCTTGVQTIEVTPPIITNCPPSQTVGTDPGQCFHSYTVTGLTANDNCDPNPTIQCTWTDPNGAISAISGPVLLPKGANTFTCTATDQCDNISQPCQYTITVVDNEPPQIQCPISMTVTGTIDPTGLCTATVSNLAAFASDNCPMSVLSWQLSGATTGTGSGNLGTTTFNQGTTTGVYTVTDMSNNTATCSFGITVVCPPDSCSCGSWLDLNYRPTQGAPNIFVDCGDTLFAQCPGLIPWTMGGFFSCTGNNCPPSPLPMWWTLTGPGTNNSGPMTGPGFNLSIPASDFNQSGYYQLTLYAICGMDTCSCDFTIAVSCTCTDNYVQNGDFSLGTPTTSDEDICLATDWCGIWPGTCPGSTADFYNATTAPPPYPGPFPLSQGNFGAMWCRLQGTAMPWREGMMNTLTTPIPQNSGNYILELQLACLGDYFGTPILSAFGVNASGLATGSCPVDGSNPLNTGLFSPGSAVELGTYTISPGCNNVFSYISLQFNASILPAAGITHIFLTRSDNIAGQSGGVFIAVDDVCLRKNTLGTDDKLESVDMRLYPNPAFSLLSIELDRPAKKDMHIRVIDLAGRQLIQQPVADGVNMQTMDISPLPQGMYLLQVCRGARVLTVKKFVKQ